ncbi:MAG: ATP-binding protein [Myxococcota bacterium]
MAFKNIIGHSEVIENLRGRIRENRLHHAIMFYGPQGIGKRTLATEFIKAINCKNFEDEPCDNCNNCKWIEKNQHPDVLIITNGIRAETLDIKLPVKMGNQDDDAEATGKPTREILIEQVRYIEEVIYTKPVEGRYRVIFIIDAESLNKSSANAFLKTLEEPPEDTIIVMTSSFLGMVPLTIRSRTEKIRLKPLGDSDMQRLLAENLNYSSNNIKLVLRLLNGSLNRMILSADDETLRECLNMAREFIVSDIITVDRILDVAQSLTQDGDRKEREARIYLFFTILREMLMDIYLNRGEEIWGKVSGINGRINLKMIEDLSGIIKFISTSQELYCNQSVCVKSELLRLTELWNKLSV